MTGKRIRVHQTGYSEFDGPVDKLPEFDPRSGEHYWIAPLVFKVDPTKLDDGPMIFDGENLVLCGPVGCYHCEAPYREHLTRRRCTGVPK